MKLARSAGIVGVEVDSAPGLLTAAGARQHAADLCRLADAADRLNGASARPQQLTVATELGEALPV